MTDLFFCSEEVDYTFSYLEYINDLTNSCLKNSDSKIRDPIYLTMTMRELELNL